MMRLSQHSDGVFSNTDGDEMRKNIFILLLILGMILPLATFAQDAAAQDSASHRGGMAFTDDQIALNNLAQKAVLEHDYQNAEVLFKAMLQLREFDVTWYSLGRTYSRQNKCKEAYDAFERVVTAPPLEMEQGDRKKFIAATQNSVSELDILCSAKVTLKCDSEQMIKIDDGDEFECTSDPIPLVPGKHLIISKSIHGITTNKFELKDNEERELWVYEIRGGIPINDSSYYLKYYDKQYKAWGWSLFGGGLAMTAVGAGVLLAKDIGGKRSTNEIVGSAFITPGGVALMAGIGTLIAEAVKSKEISTRDHDRYDREIDFDPLWGDLARQYESWGWGLFGTGLELIAIGTGVMFADDIGKQGTNAIIFASLGSLGGVALISGISLLLAKTYIIDDYRAEGFNLQPELFVSPEMTGIGFSGRF
ncbi:MAG: tetratricopeptide repeat protein [Proteobacteria bacterium]|nr:tetratricopeptide repeat protein [Pseudomonadota bacterium]